MAKYLFVPSISQLSIATACFFGYSSTACLSLPWLYHLAADLVVLDLDGLGKRAGECIGLFCELHPAVRILGLFDAIHRRRAVEALTAGAEAVLPQPCYPAEVETILRRWAARERDRSQQALAADLLSRGLEQETRRAQAETALGALTPREREVAWLTARGYTNHQIAQELVISSETVKTHVRHALEKFDLHSKAELRLLLLGLGIRWQAS